MVTTQAAILKLSPGGLERVAPWAHTGHGGNLRLDVEQEHLQGVVVLVVDEHDGVEVVVPVADGVEQGDGGQHRQAQGQVDGEGDTHLTGAVDAGGLV